MTSATLNPFDLHLEVVDSIKERVEVASPCPLLVRDVPLDVLQPTFEGACIGPAQGHGPERADYHDNNHAQQVANHPASLPPDLAEVLVRQQYNEDEINSEREAGYRKGWNDHARHMLRMLAARESQ